MRISRSEYTTESLSMGRNDPDSAAGVHSVSVKDSL